MREQVERLLMMAPGGMDGDGSLSKAQHVTRQPLQRLAACTALKLSTQHPAASLAVIEGPVDKIRGQQAGPQAGTEGGVKGGIEAGVGELRLAIKTNTAGGWETGQSEARRLSRTLAHIHRAPRPSNRPACPNLPLGIVFPSALPPSPSPSPPSHHQGREPRAQQFPATGAAHSDDLSSSLSTASLDCQSNPLPCGDGPSDPDSNSPRSHDRDANHTAPPVVKASDALPPSLDGSSDPPPSRNGLLPPPIPSPPPPPYSLRTRRRHLPAPRPEAPHPRPPRPISIEGTPAVFATPLAHSGADAPAGRTTRPSGTEAPPNTATTPLFPADTHGSQHSSSTRGSTPPSLPPSLPPWHQEPHPNPGPPPPSPPPTTETLAHLLLTAASQRPLRKALPGLYDALRLPALFLRVLRGAPGRTLPGAGPRPGLHGGGGLAARPDGDRPRGERGGGNGGGGGKG
ncbi:hypothetical protein NSK_004625 [Nannochloropsis salina CCMP1776]|uniref:Uncharacterized protein n=1 Tax=Nannochloropsis salina CCMP1776 TaxID=1027361 RepID=A0A4D9D2A9_9STRA|nr:hypothetical protein NSK_004625 [Nannochloropsis salina CCMP1776]|eukprot:TFJ84153.1 hypothetical protein NSK_004625 [Nannochloropsis salina CCMP1776]